MNRVFVHLVDFSEYIAKEIIGKIVDSKLIDNAQLDIFCNYDRQKFDWLRTLLGNHSNVKLHYNTAEPTDFELPTLKYLKDIIDSSDQDSNVLYLHHKGAANPNNLCVDDWRRFMLYYNVEKWVDCVEKLDSGYDTVGVNLHEKPLLHYSGNIWWAKSSYIKKLPNIKMPRDVRYVSQFNIERPGPYAYRFDAEFWIGLGSPYSFTFKNSNINHYHYRYTDFLGEKSTAYYVKA